VKSLDSFDFAAVLSLNKNLMRYGCLPVPAVFHCEAGKLRFVSQAFPNGYREPRLQIEFWHPSWVRDETRRTETMNFLRSHGLFTLRSTRPKTTRSCRRSSKLQATRSMFAFMARTARTGSNATLRQPSGSNICIRKGSSSHFIGWDQELVLLRVLASVVSVRLRWLSGGRRGRNDGCRGRDEKPAPAKSWRWRY
jgi:hypothetical protein